MKKVLCALCVAVCGCSHPSEPRGDQPTEPGQRDDTEQPDTTFFLPDLPPKVIVPDIDGFDWQEYGENTVKVQFRIKNAEECELKSATILYGLSPESLMPAETEVYTNGRIIATISGINIKESRYIFVCEVVTPTGTYRTEPFGLV